MLLGLEGIWQKGKSKMNKEGDTFHIVIAIIAVLIFFIGVVHYTEDIPVVYWSTSEDKCVKIRIYGKDCDCSELDSYKRYERIWVK